MWLCINSRIAQDFGLSLWSLQAINAYPTQILIPTNDPLAPNSSVKQQ